MRFFHNLFYWLAGTVDKDRFWRTRLALQRAGRKTPLYWMRRLYYVRAQRVMNAYLPLTAQIAGRPEFPHNIAGVFISKEAVIGSDCVIFQQVIIGANTTEGSARFGSPVIGDRCVIGAGARIIGRVRIGSDVRIGAGCVVAQDIPDHATVVADRPRIIVRESAPDGQ